MIYINIKAGGKIICVKFANVGQIDCIQEHLSILENIGHVWFGKLGIKPSAKILNTIMEEESKYIILREPKGTYICEVEAASDLIPEENEFPSYYLTENLVERGFSVWFKLTSIIKVTDLNVLEKVVIQSSKRPVLEVCGRSMNSYFYAKALQDITI